MLVAAIEVIDFAASDEDVTALVSLDGVFARSTQDDVIAFFRLNLVVARSTVNKSTQVAIQIDLNLIVTITAQHQHFSDA